MSAAAKLGIAQEAQSDSLDVRHGFNVILKAAREAPAADLPDLIGQLECIKAVAWARIAAPTPASQEHDELIGVVEAAQRLGVSDSYLYTHSREYPFTRRQGRKLLFSALGIDRHIRQTRT